MGLNVGRYGLNIGCDASLHVGLLGYDVGLNVWYISCQIYETENSVNR